MPTVGDAYREGLAVTRSSPRYVAWTVLLSAVGTGLGFALERVPYGLGTLLNTVVVTPLLVAVLLGLAVAGLGGHVSTDAGVESAREHYAALVGVFVILVLVALLAMVAVAFAAALVALFLLGYRPDPAAAAGSREAAASVDPSLLLAIALVGVPAFLGLFTLLQFVDVAVVVGGDGPLSAYVSSLRLCWEAPLSVLAYTAVRLGTFAVAGVLPAAVWLAGGGAGGALVSRGIAVGLGVLLLSLAYAVLNAYHVAYYRRMMTVD